MQNNEQSIDCLQGLKQCINYNNKKYYCFKLSAPEDIDYKIVNNRTVLVIDISGSMGVLANNTSTKEQTNLTVLDIVKHTAKTIVNVQNNNDELAIVTYSTNADIVLNLTKMDNVGKNKALQVINNIQVDGMTNIYDGITKAYEIIKQCTTSNYNTTIMLLSDGVPNIEPPQGTYLQFKKDVEDSTIICPRINTFGFGYNVDVQVLKNLSTISQGSFGFIPDSNFVGTVIINNLANTMCTLYNNTTLSIILPKDNYKILGDYKFQKTTWGAKINIGDIKIGQPRHIIVETPIDINIDNKDIIITSTNVKTSITNKYDFIDDVFNDTTVLYNMFRLKGVELLSQLRSNDSSVKLVNEFIKKMEDSKSSEQLDGLIKDFKGQVLESISSNNIFTKWDATSNIKLDIS
jgi:Mg-chelatase subunit ChlD